MKEKTIETERGPRPYFRHYSVPDAVPKKERLTWATLRKGFAVVSVFALLAVSTAPSALAVKPASPGNSGAIWTTNSDCGEDTQNENHYSVGEDVYIKGSGFDADEYDWDITGQPGEASNDPNVEVAGGSKVVDESGNFCFKAYTILEGDGGEYKATFGNKHDNFRVGKVLGDTDEPCEFGNDNDNENVENALVPIDVNFCLDIGVNKVWLDENGEEVDAPDTGLENLEITVAATGEAPSVTCTYDPEFDCTGTLIVEAGSNIDVTETGLPDGWFTKSGTGSDIEADCEMVQSLDVNIVVDCDITVENQMESEGGEDDTNLHFIKVVCDDFSDVMGNESGTTADATEGMYVNFSNYNGGAFTPSALVSGFVDPSEIPSSEDGCVRVPGWEFQLSTDQAQTANLMTTPVTTGNSSNAEYSTMVSELPDALEEAANSGQLWISEVEQEGYDFAAIRCYNDALNGDNLEFISLNGETPEDVYCIAYNIDEDGDTTGDTITGTKFNDANGDAQQGEGEAGLAGFEIVAVDADPSYTYTVDSTDTDGSSQDVPAGEYLVLAMGTWENRQAEGDDEFFDAEYGTVNTWTDHMDGTEGYAGAGLNEGDLMVNNAFADWGPYMGSHTYAITYTHAGGPLNFTIFDGDADTGTPNAGWYGDNTGSLTVHLHEVLASDVTDASGNYELTIPDSDSSIHVLEIQQDGFTQTFPTGDGMHDVDLSTGSTFSDLDFGNKRGSVLGDVDPQLHFIKVVCTEFNDVMGNESGTTADATEGMYTEFSNYNGGAFTPSPLVSGFVDPSEIPGTEGTDCERVTGWNFKLSSDQSQTADVQVYGPTAGDSSNAEFAIAASGLTDNLENAINSGQLWISEVEQEGYDFAAIRCYNDALNGDNLEFISLNGETPEDVYCIAYNVAEDEPEPCTETLGWAADVVISDQGTRNDGSAITDPNRTNPAEATGPADWASGTGTNFFSLGEGGSITLSFDGFVNDETGDDLAIYEATNGTYPDERANIEVSQNGTDWQMLTEQATNTSVGGKTSVDFSETGLAWIKYVRLTDATNFALHDAAADGYDLDAVEAINETCEEPEEPQPCVDGNLDIMSGASTIFRGLATGTAPATLSDASLYSSVNTAAVEADSTGFPGAWDTVENDPLVADAMWVSNSASQPSNPDSGNGLGTEDSWRLFSHTFTIPADADTNTPTQLYFAADNAVTIFLNDVEIANTTSFGSVSSVSLPTLTAGTEYTLEFAVRNDGITNEENPSDGEYNPTGLIYNLDIAYDCDASTNGGGGGGGGSSSGSSRRSGGSVLGDTDFGPGLQMPFISEGEVLGDTTTEPSGEVLGDSDTLPRTGWSLLALSLIMLAAGVISAKRLTVKKS